MTNRETWGPHMWYTIHFIALGYPIDASSIDKKNYKNFYINLPNIIPCDECAKHLVNNLNNFSIDNYLESRDKLFEWTVILHNQVNKMLGKKEWNLDIAKKYYLNFNIKLEETNKCFNKSYIIIIILLTIILYLLLRNKNMFKNL